MFTHLITIAPWAISIVHPPQIVDTAFTQHPRHHWSSSTHPCWHFVLFDITSVVCDTSCGDGDLIMGVVLDGVCWSNCIRTWWNALSLPTQQKNMIALQQHHQAYDCFIHRWATRTGLALHGTLHPRLYLPTPLIAVLLEMMLLIATCRSSIKKPPRLTTSTQYSQQTSYNSFQITSLPSHFTIPYKINTKPPIFYNLGHAITSIIHLVLRITCIIFTISTASQLPHQCLMFVLLCWTKINFSFSIGFEMVLIAILLRSTTFWRSYQFPDLSHCDDKICGQCSMRKTPPFYINLSSIWFRTTFQLFSLHTLARSNWINPTPKTFYTFCHITPTLLWS